MSKPKARHRSALLLWAALGPVGLCSCQGPPDPGEAPEAVPVPARPHRIAVLTLGGTAELADVPPEAIEKGLKLFGYERGAHYTWEVVDLGGDLAATGDAVARANRGEVDLLVVTHPLVLRSIAAGKVERPVVFGILGDPLALGVGGPEGGPSPAMTGAYNPLPAFHALALIRQYLPGAKRVGVVFEGRDPLASAHKDALIKESPRLDLEVLAVDAGGEDGLTAAASELLRRPVDALCLVAGREGLAARLIGLAREARVPVFGFSEHQARSGALAAEVPDPGPVGAEAGRAIFRVLSGAGGSDPPPARLIDSSTYVNTNVADDLGITLPPAAFRNALPVGGPPDPAPK